MIEITAYKCEHCEKKILKSKSGMYKHEASCFANPQMRACMTCEHYFKADRQIKSIVTGKTLLDGCNEYEEMFDELFKFRRYCKGYKQANERNW